MGLGKVSMAIFKSNGGASQVVLLVEYLSANAGDTGLIPGLGRSPGGRDVNPLQYSCLKNSMDRGAWRGTLHGVSKESDMTEQLGTHLGGCSRYKTRWNVVCLKQERKPGAAELTE